MDKSRLRGLSEDSSPLERAQTLQYFEELNSSPEGWKICATHLTHNTGSHHVEFFCLQVVERHVRNRHACTSDDNILSLRRILLSWMQDSTERKPFIGKKMAQIVALTFVIDYPQKWPAFFSDLLQCAGTGVQTSVELYLRVLLAIDEEVVDRQIIHTREESARNAVIKDTMRDHCAASLVDSWYQIMHRYEDICPALTNLAMEVVGTYISWIDITLIANDKFLQRLLHYLSVLALRESAAECLREIISKGMEPLPKIELVESLTKMLQSMHILSTASEEDTDAEFRMRLSALICGMGCALVNSWNKLLKRGNAMDIQVARTAIEEKLLYLHKYLNDEDDGVSEAMIPFAVQYLSVLKHCANLSDNDRANLQTLLHTVINKYKYDEDYNFLSQGEDEVTFLDYRKELKVLIDNIAMLDSSLVLQTTQSVLSSHLANLTTQPFMNVEVALRILYQVGEAITDKKFGACNIVGSPWHQMMTIVLQSNVAQHSHTAVLLQFYETIVRYEKFFTTESHYISGIMEVFLSEQGLRHSNCSVRSRVCYMFVRFVKGVRNQLGSIARDILNNLQELLVLLPDTKGNEGYLSGNDMMFLYEAAGILVVASLLPPEDKGLLMSQLLFPLVQKFPLYLEQLSKAEASSEQEETAQLLHHILSFASRASKVFTNHQMTVQNGCLDCFAEPLPVFLQGLEVSVQCSQLQAGVRQYLHRMIICLGDELLKYVPVAVSLLLKNCKSQEIQEFIPLINQLVAKYKERISPFLQDVFMPVVQTIVTCLGQPFDPNDSEAQRDHLSLQKCYFLFLNSLATNNVTEVIAKGANNLEEVLGTLVQGAVTFPDPTVQKVCFGVLRRIIDVWAPEGAMPGFVDYMYKNILPACFLAPLEPNFDLNDGNSFVVLGEIAGALKAMINARGGETIAYLQSDYLPTLRMPPPVLEEFIQRIQEFEARQLRQYFKIVGHSLFQGGDPGSSSYINKFEDECSLLKSARHPNIVQYLDTYRDPETNLPVLLMELCDESLTNLLERSPGPLPYHLELNISHDVALALDYLHSNDLIHRDLTSNNILMIAGARAKITDFGVSKLLSVNPRFTKTMVPGNMLYMPPEAFDEPPRYTDKLDVFSFGVLLIQVMTRHFPDPGDRYHSIFDPRYATTVKVPIIETERRKVHLQEIENTHPLKSVTLQCLKDKEKDRPSAQQVSEDLSALKQAPQYTQSVQYTHPPGIVARQKQTDPAFSKGRDSDEMEELRSRLRQLELTVSAKDTQIAQKQWDIERQEAEIQQSQRTVEAKERELQQNNQQMLTSIKLVQQYQEQVQQKDNTISDLQRIVATYERRIQHLEKEGSRCTPPHQHLSLGGPAASKTVTSAAVHNSAEARMTSHPSTLKWKLGNRAPEGMAAGTAVVHGNTAFFNPSGSNRIYSFQVTSGKGQWASFANSQYTGFSLALVNNMVTTIGGFKSGKPETTNLLLSLAGSGHRKKQEWSKVYAPMPTARGNTAAISTERFLVVAGGKVGGNRPKKLDTIEVMNTSTRQWTVSTRLPNACSDLTCAIYDGRLYLAGGYKGEEATKDVLTCSLNDLLQNFPISSGTQPRIWQLAQNLPVVRSALVVCDDQLLAIGGRDDSRNPSDSVLQYDARSNSWHAISRFSTKHSVCFAVSVCPKQIVVVGGYIKINDVYTATDNVEITIP